MIVELHNIQSIAMARYDIAEKGITQIVGDNSNGKSILIKAMAFVANNLIKDKDQRESLINDNANMGIIIMSRNGMTLKVVVSRARENCYYELTRKDGSVITRTIREGGMEHLSDEFGWVSFNDEICLQVFETFGVMPFVNNRASSDYEIMDYIITDKVANNFIESYEKVTYPEFKRQITELKAKSDSCSRILDGITFYDIKSYEDIKYKLEYFKRIIPNMIPYEPTRLPITKYLKYSELIPMEFKRLPIFRVFPNIPEFKSIRNELANFSSVMCGVCPTCGIKFSDLEEHIHEV